MTTVIDRLTLSTVPLEQYFNNTRLGQGTGFMWRAGGRDYLVTNWHVLSNRNLFTGKNLSANGGRPNRLRAMFSVKTGFFDRHQLEFKIWDDDDRPLWPVHPTRHVDIAVLPIDVVARPINSPNNLIQLPLYPINELANAKLRIGIGMEVFILGYPFPIELPGYPVWKRGSIASEPQLASLTSALGSAVKQTEYMLVDTASRPGMSGAPVIRRSWSNHDIAPDFIATAGSGPSGTGKQFRLSTPIDRFIGVYSGRARTDHSDEAQIGLVWNGSLIEEIIVGKRRDTD